MCLILLAKDQHPTYKLVVAANRDEFYHRQTREAHFWDSNPDILGGKDLEAGGTWMGINKNRQLGMLTNYRDLTNIKSDAPSRGHLVSGFLDEEQAAADYMKKVAEDGEAYNGFNLICGTADQLYYYGNYQKGVTVIPPGIHGLSNALLNTEWPKVEKGKDRLKEVMQSDDPDPAKLFDLLYDSERAQLEALPSTGVGQEMEHMLSPMFIKSDNYGSRSSTVLLVDKDDQMTFIERTYDMEDFTYIERYFQL